MFLVISAGDGAKAPCHRKKPMTKAGKVQSSIVRQEIFINMRASNCGQVRSDRGVEGVGANLTLRILTKCNLTMYSQATGYAGGDRKKTERQIFRGMRPPDESVE